MQGYIGHDEAIAAPKVGNVLLVQEVNPNKDLLGKPPFVGAMGNALIPVPSISPPVWKPFSMMLPSLSLLMLRQFLYVPFSSFVSWSVASADSPAQLQNCKPSVFFLRSIVLQFCNCAGLSVNTELPSESSHRRGTARLCTKETG